MDKRNLRWTPMAALAVLLAAAIAGARQAGPQDLPPTKVYPVSQGLDGCFSGTTTVG